MKACSSRPRALSLSNPLKRYVNSSSTLCLSAPRPRDCSSYSKSSRYLSTVSKVQILSPTLSSVAEPVESRTAKEGEWLKGGARWWTNSDSQRVYLNWLGKTLGFVKPEDWYGATREDFRNNGGYGLLAHFGGIPSTVICSVYPTYELYPWLFDKAPIKYFKDRANREKYFKWLSAKTGVKGDLQVKHFYENAGRSLLRLYNGSPQAFLNSLKLDSDEGDSTPLIEPKKPRNYWASLENQRKFLDSLGKELGVKDGDLSPWYKATIKAIRRAGGSGVIYLYGNSIYSMLKKVYPEYDWIPWKFEYIPKGTSADPKVLEGALKVLEGAVKSDRPEDLARTSRVQLRELGIEYIFRVNGGLSEVLKKMRPLDRTSPSLKE